MPIANLWPPDKRPKEWRSGAIETIRDLVLSSAIEKALEAVQHSESRFSEDTVALCTAIVTVAQLHRLQGAVAL